MIAQMLFKRHVNGLGTWKIVGDRETGLILIYHATVEGGSEVMHEERVTTNRSGRSLADQVDLRVNSRIGRMKDRGYKESREAALDSQTNQLNLKRPMLAKSYDKVSKVDYSNAILQKKLDGHRCLITRQDGELIAYSRQGKPISSISHIIDRLHDLPEGVTLDGELYKHGVPLQTLASWIKKAQPESASLSYVVYDTISDDPFLDRLAEVEELLRGKSKLVPVLRGRPFKTELEMWDYHKEAVLQGFEGLILRTNDRGYEAGVRSSSLIKIKRFNEMEVTVKDIEPSKEAWAVLVCGTDDGKEVRCSAPGTKHEKTLVLGLPEEYIGKQVTLQYSVLTKTGVPFHPVALRWREDI